MVFGGLIIFFLIVEPHGLARLWQIGKEKLRLWPFPALSDCMRDTAIGGDHCKTWIKAANAGRMLGVQQARSGSAFDAGSARRNQAAHEQFIPLPVLPGRPVRGRRLRLLRRLIDYLNLINADGGVNGVKLIVGRMRDRVQRVARRRVLRAPEEEERRRHRWSIRCRPASPTA